MNPTVAAGRSFSLGAEPGVVTGEPQLVLIKTRELKPGMLVPVRQLENGQVRIAALRVVAASRSWDLAMVYWQLEGDHPDWCWTAAADEYVPVVIGCEDVPGGGSARKAVRLDDAASVPRK